MTESHLKQPGYTYSPCGPFTKHQKKFEKFRETGNLKYLYKNELDKACFAHDKAHSDLAMRSISDKILKDRAMKLLEIVNMMDVKEH